MKSKFRSFREAQNKSCGGPLTLTVKMEAWRLEMEPWKVYKPAVADFHPKKHDPDPDPH